MRADIAQEPDVLALFRAADVVGPVRDQDVNVLGTILCFRETVRGMSTADGHAGDSIVPVSSAASRIGSAGEYIDYAVSKGAVDSLFREVAAEGIRVDAVRPGTTSTEIHERNGQSARVRDLELLIPLRRAARGRGGGAVAAQRCGLILRRLGSGRGWRMLSARSAVNLLGRTQAEASL